MDFIPDSLIVKTTKEIFNRQDIKLTNIAINDAYTTITGKPKYIKTEMDLIILLYQLWSDKGSTTITLDSSVKVTTKKLNSLLGVARTVSSTLANLKKYSVHEKKVFDLDENGNKIAIGRKNGKTVYSKSYTSVIPEKELFRVTCEDDYVRNEEGEIIGRDTIYTIKPAPLLIKAFKELELIKDEPVVTKKPRIQSTRRSSQGRKRNE